MKKLWNARKDSEGVSPVIATILMVAITVVLAAILMVMVMGMTGSPTPTSATLSASDSAGTVTVQIINVGGAGVADFTVFAGNSTANMTEVAGSFGTGVTTISAGAIFTATTASDLIAGDTVQLKFKGTVIGTAVIGA